MEVPPAPDQSSGTIRLHDPETYSPPEGPSWQWQRLFTVANLPHVEAKFVARPGGQPHTALFMLDSGNHVDLVS